MRLISVGRLYALFVLWMFAGVLNAAGQTVAPPNSVLKAGNVYGLASGAANVGTGNVAGGYFGNGSGALFDVAITNSTGAGNQLFVLQGNGDGSFSLQPSGIYNFGTAVQDGLNLIVAGPVVSPTSKDLVVTDDRGSLYLLKGNGDGTFQAPSSLNQVTNTLSSYLNSSGMMNLVISTFSSITVLVNGGSGNFTPTVVPVPARSSPNVTSAFALNVGGFSAVLQLYSDGTAGLSQQVSGAFQPPVLLGALGIPSGSAVESQSLSVFTFNGQPYLAGIVSTSTGALTSVASAYVWPFGVVGGGIGISAMPSLYSIPTNDAVYVTSADVDGDGIPDLIVLGGAQFSVKQTINLFLSGSPNGFAPPEIGTVGTPNEILGPGEYGIEVLVADVNGDGKNDLLLYEPSQGLAVLLNQGSGVFLTPTTYLAGNNPTSIAKADFNGDGIDDLVVANGLNSANNTSDNTISVFVSKAAGSYASQVTYPTGTHPIAVTTGKVNGNQSVFVLSAADTTGNFSNPEVGFLQGNGDGTFQPAVNFPTGTASSAQPTAIAAGAFDASGNSTVAVGNSDGTINLFTYQAGAFVKGSTLKATSAAPAYGLSLSSLAVDDMNGDGNLDLVATLRAQCGYNLDTGQMVLTGGAVLIFVGNGAGAFQPPAAVISSEANYDPASVSLGSLVTASRTDMLVMDAHGNAGGCGGLAIPNPIVFTNGGNLTFSESDLPAQFGGVSSMPEGAIADVNGDGANDLIFSQNGLVSALLNSGTGTFTSTPTIYVGSSSSAGLMAGSFFGPGGHDVAMASSAGAVVISAIGGNAQQSTPFATFSPLSLNFGNVGIGTHQTLALTLQNTGTAILNVPFFAIQATDGSAAPQFSTDSVQCGSTLNPASLTIPVAGSCMISFGFTPTAGGASSAEVLFADNAPFSNVTSAPIMGFAPFQQIIPLQGTAPLVPIQISPGILPIATMNQGYLQSFSAIGGSGGYTFSETGSLPNGMTFSNGVLSGTPTVVGTFPITITVTDSSLNTGKQTYNLVVNCAALAVSPSSVPPATAGVLYLQTFHVSGGTAPYTWTLGGTTNIPSGLVFTGGSSGILSGTATGPSGGSTLGSFTWSIQDAIGCSATLTDQLVVYSPISIVSIPAPLPGGTVGDAYSQSTFTAAGGVGPYTYSGILLPPGLNVNSATGVLSGTPMTAGTYSNAGVIVTDSRGATGVLVESITISPALLADSVSLSDATILSASSSFTLAGPFAYYSTGGVGFPNTPPGQTSTQLFGIANVGTGPLNLMTGTISPAGAFTISQISCSSGDSALPTTLPVGGSCAITLSFLGPSSGPTPNATISFTDDSAFSNLPSQVSSAGNSFMQSISIAASAGNTPPPPMPSVVSALVAESVSTSDVVGSLITVQSITVRVTPVDTTTGSTPVTLTFTNVTQPGITTLTTSPTGPAPPPGFQQGNPGVFYNLSTTAIYLGPVTICINYTGISFTQLPHMYHYQSGAWMDVTTSINTANMIVCGTTTSFSPFALFQPSAFSTTTAIPATGVSYGTPGNVSVSVTSSGGTVTGSVSLSVDGGTASALALSNGSAVFNLGVLNAATHTLSASFAAQGTFLASSAAGTISVGQVPLTIAANNATRMYGGANPTLTASYAGFVNGDTASILIGALNCSTAAAPASPVGAYAINCSGQSAANYSITYLPGKLAVTPATLTIAANNVTKNFDAPNPTLTWTASGFVNGDSSSVLATSPTCTTTATTTSPVGSYPITCSGAAAANYTFTYVPGSLTVTCHYVSIGLSPSTVAQGGLITVSWTLRSCANTTQTVAFSFALSGPAQPDSCSPTKSEMFSLPPFALKPNTLQSFSFPFRIPKGICPGTYSTSASTTINGQVVDTSSTSLTITAH
jgi:hypothetical protein